MTRIHPSVDMPKDSGARAHFASGTKRGPTEGAWGHGAAPAVHPSPAPVRAVPKRPKAPRKAA
jgi:hypothetical protein